MSDDRSARGLLVEGLVIVVSILLAFAIDAWWDDRQQAEERERILGQLREELSLYQQIVPRAIAASNRASDASIRLLEIIHGENDVSPDELRATVAAVDDAFALAAAVPVFELLAGAGGFTLVPDPELRQAISDITAFISLTERFEDMESRSLRAWKEHLRDHYDLYGAGRALGYYEENMPPSRFPEDFSFLEDRTTSNLLYERRARARAVNRFREELLMHTETAVAIIDQAAAEAKAAD